MTRMHPSQLLVILISLTTSNNTWWSVAFPYSVHQGTMESRKNLEQKLIFQIGTLNPHGINKHFSFN